MKKLIMIGLFYVIFTTLAILVLHAGANENKLYLLNWGEYIDDELVSDFESQYQCEVVLETVTSSETMYQKITAGTTTYDVAIPGDYMVEKMYNEGYLKELDINNDSKYPNLAQFDNLFVDDLQNLRKENLFEGNEKYCMPYFWGAYSMIYSNQNNDVERVVKENGFKALYDRSLYAEKVKIGMYSTARWTVASYMMSQNLNPNTEDFSNGLKEKVVSAIKNVNFDMWADDNLKKATADGKLDLCFTQLGDFFDALWLSLDEGKDINFNVSVPTNTAAFFDAMVIPTTCQNYDLANAFINFMLDSQNAYQNAQAIGYCPTLKSVVDLYLEDADAGEYYYGDEDTEGSITLKDFLDTYPMYLNPLNGVTNVTLFEPKDKEYMTLCETIVNQAKA